MRSITNNDSLDDKKAFIVALAAYCMKAGDKLNNGEKLTANEQAVLELSSQLHRGFFWKMYYGDGVNDMGDMVIHKFVNDFIVKNSIVID